jgi:hypothetical protein
VRRLLLACLLALPGCYASNTLSESERSVAPTTQKASWRAAGKDDLPGLWASTAIEGQSAGAVLKVYYAFDADGGWSGVALVLGEDGPRFVQLATEGSWTLADAALDLHDGAPPAQAWVDGPRLRLVAGDDRLELSRVPLD